MTDFSVTSYNPYNRYYNCGYSYPNFKGTECSARSNYYNNVPLPTQQSKSVSFSASDQIEKKKEGLSTGAKWGLGILAVVGLGAIAYACVVGHRVKAKPGLEEVTKNFSEIFRRDISTEEAAKMAEKYKEIFLEKDKDTFCKKIFEQVKNDYGYKKDNIPLVFENLGIAGDKGIVMAHWNPFYCNVAINTEYLKAFSQNLTKEGQENISSAIIHEFQHVKQYEYAYRTNPKKCLNSISNEKRAIETLKFMFKNNLEQAKKSLLENNPSEFKTISDVEKFIKTAEKKLQDKTYKQDSQILEVLKSITEQRTQPMKDLFSTKEQFIAGSKEFQLGEKYLDNHEHYINAKDNLEGYKKQIIEAEAYGTKSKAKQIYKYIVNPWKIF